MSLHGLQVVRVRVRGESVAGGEGGMRHLGWVFSFERLSLSLKTPRLCVHVVCACRRNAWVGGARSRSGLGCWLALVHSCWTMCFLLP